MEKEFEQKFDDVLQKMDAGFVAVQKQFDDVLQVVAAGFKGVDERFEAVDTRFEAMDKRFDTVDTRLERLEEDNKIFHSTMVTKQYLDDKLADLGAEIGRRINTLSQREIAFSRKLLEYLKEDKALTKEHIDILEEMLA